MDNDIGFHMSTKNIGFYGALKFIISAGGNGLQVFMRSQEDDFEDFVESNDILKAKRIIEQYNSFFVAHSMINLANDYELNFSNLKLLVVDFKKVDFLNGRGVVVHIGDYLQENSKVAFENIKRSVEYILKNTPKRVKFLFENVAGQNREDGFKFDELRQVYDLFLEEEKKRIGFVIDTCHSFASGYDLRDKKSVDFWYDEIGEVLGWDKVVCVHLNDSYGKLGSKLDKHSDFGFGNIGIKGLDEIAILMKKIKIPIIIETPSVNETKKEQINMFKGWV